MRESLNDLINNTRAGGCAANRNSEASTYGGEGEVVNRKYIVITPLLIHNYLG